MIGTYPPMDSEQQLREMNEALLVSSVRQHELAEQAEEATRASQAALRESEARFRQMIDALPAAVYTVDAKGKLTHFNPAAVEFAGRVPLLNEDDWCINQKLFLDDGTPLPLDQNPMALAIREGRTIRGIEAIAERPDGTRVWGATNATPLRNTEGEIVGGINMIVDITERKRAEFLIQCQKQSLEMLVSGEPLEPVLDFLARSMESQSQGGFLVAIHLLEADGCHFGYVAAPSLPASYAHATKGMDARLELGPCSSAVVSHEPTLVRDFAAQPRWPAFSAEVISLGLHGCFTTPIISSGRNVIGTFAIYYREPRDPSPRDQQLVDIVTHTVAIAIERKQVEAKLREAEERFRHMADNIPQLAWIADAGTDGQVHWFNQNWYDFTGTTLEQMQGQGWHAAGGGPRRVRPIGVRDDGAPGEPNGAAGGRFARREPHQPGQDRTSPRSDRTGIVRPPRRRSRPLAAPEHEP